MQRVLLSLAPGRGRVSQLLGVQWVALLITPGCSMPAELQVLGKSFSSAGCADPATNRSPQRAGFRAVGAVPAADGF